MDRNVIREFVFPSKESVPRQNNRRAIVIHFVLTVVGVILFALAQFLVFIITPLFGIYSIGFDDLPMQLALLGALIVWLILYVACGYLFLDPMVEKSYLSVFWLARMLVIVGAFFVIVGVVAWLGELLGVGTFDGLVGAAFALFLLMN
ncbi:MAG: hypothetical protein FWD93_05405, partial [Coriobacteriia bacterium]|nr:hypothetical protein [Coriobacteriia bacterium]